MKTQDRRYLRTQIAIFKALSSLLLEKDFTDITINDISQAADINRSTFYLHFEDKYALLDAYIWQSLPSMILEEEEDLSRFPYDKMIDTILGQLYDYLHNHHQLFKRLFNDTNYSFVLPAIRKALEQFFERNQRLFNNQLGESEEFTRFIRITGLIAMIEWYLKQDEEEREQFVKETRDLILLLESR